MTASEEVQKTFQQQVDTISAAVTGHQAPHVLEQCESLAARLPDLPPPSNAERLPFVIVVTSNVLSTRVAFHEIVDERGKRAVVEMSPVEPTEFTPRVELPDSDIYLLADIDLGAVYLGVRPADALTSIEAAGRLPLTLDEGVAVLMHHPDVLTTRNAYQLLASRRGDDKRIPSIWRSYGQPRLGWCWQGAPHSWMGSASAAARIV